MYTKTSPDQTMFLDKVGEDEPIFILRARDSLAVMAILAWITEAVEADVNEYKIAEAYRHLAAFHDWAYAHSTRLPD